MFETPNLVDRDEVTYLSWPAAVPFAGLDGAVDDGFPRLFGWLAEHGVVPTAAPFIRYRTVDMAGELQVDLGVPVPAGTTGDAAMAVATLPAGRYATLLHVGPYDGLIEANAALLAWAGREGVTFDRHDDDGGAVWAARVEHYLTNPAEAPDPATWEVEIAYLTT